MKLVKWGFVVFGGGSGDFLIFLGNSGEFLHSWDEGGVNSLKFKVKSAKLWNPDFVGRAFKYVRVF